MAGSAPRRGSGLAVLALSAVMGAVAAAAYAVLAGAPPLVAPRPFGFPVLLALFFLAEVCVVHVHVRRQAQSFSFTDAPLVLGVAFFSPLTALVARLAGSALALVLVRRQRPIKIVFNLAWFALEAGVVTGIVHLAAHDPLEPAGWLTLLAATLTGLVLGSAFIALAIAVSEGIRPPRLVDIVGGLGPVSSVLGTGGGLLAAVVLRSSSSAWILLVGAAALGLVALRSHAALRERHQRLERAHAFTTDAVAAIEAGEDRRALLERACELLRAEWAELAIAGDDELDALYLTNRGGELRVETGSAARTTLARHLALLDGAASRIVDGAAGDPFDRAVLAALPEQLRQPGTFLVADRLGGIDRFDDGDRRLLEALAAQAAVVVRNRALLDRLRRQSAEREHQALHDALTGLPNRLRLDTELTRAVEERRADGLVAVLLVDLDRFKEVNDTLGHQQGDRLLGDVAARIASVVPAAALVARLGGDEFAILVPEGVAGCEDDVVAIARRMLAALTTPFQLAELLVDVGASVGIALCPEHATDATDLLRRADVAMYAAKARGLGVATYDPADDRSSRERLGLVAELRTAIEWGHLLVEFQPVVELTSGRPAGAEALCRWHHPTRGLVPPDEFIPLAEAAGLIAPLTKHVLGIALAHLARWRHQGADVGVSVNLSVRSLLDESLPATVVELLTANRVPPSCLTLEVTESSFLSDPARALGVVSRLSSLGVRLSIDDFGTGYSSLSQLHQLPVDEVKIDRSFVRDLAHRREDVAVVRAIIDLGRALGLEVTAEGIEDARTLQVLAGLGCHRGQGYHLSKPMPPAMFERWLRQAAADDSLVESLLRSEPVRPQP